MFVVTVDGVRGLAVFSNTVWGEADCFVQYHFPTTGERDEEEGKRPALLYQDFFQFGGLRRYWLYVRSVAPNLLG